ncbi:GumC family protein [Roseobacter sinensis]|uniref:Lipopolysaccharide biosynthesis n=1 Tax=Roseobacter sinensis TaxID=2931391 RepID=A0ABT3BJQ2_9RHOB|nr:lipopolysaccharide biosynthesis [Roseobacter sp. WL0113]MCV3273806.1 lipopolysaccharide biosynthesis [Roseobacter sp. WL0113]
MINDLKFYLRLLVRRSPAMVALFLLAACIGVLMALRLPPTFSTSAQLLVESPQIPDSMVRSTIDVDPLEQLEVIQQRLLTRANLLDVARNNNIFPNQSAMNPDDVVAQMRSRTSIKRTSGRNRATLMTVGFRGDNPNKVTGVVNEYVTIILSANSSFRAERAENTLDFFQKEVSDFSTELNEINARIVQFKNENADALPENLNFRLERQSFLQERLSRAERDRDALVAQRENIKRIFQTAGALNPAAAQPARSPEEAELRRLQSELRSALGVYSEQNPKIKLLRNRIETLTAQIGVQALNDTASDLSPEELAETQRVEAFEVSLAEIDTRIETIDEEIVDITAELGRLQDTIERTPANRIALDDMERDRENTRSLYNSAVQGLSQARTGERIELSARGQRITVLEPASVPRRPSGPNRSAIAGMGVAIGLALAGAFFFLLEFINQSIRRPSEIENALQITPLITIPSFEPPARRRWRHILLLSSTGLVIISVPIILWAVDTYYMPLDLVFQKLKDLVL